MQVVLVLGCSHPITYPFPSAPNPRRAAPPAGSAAPLPAPPAVTKFHRCSFEPPHSRFPHPRPQACSTPASACCCATCSACTPSTPPPTPPCCRATPRGGWRPSLRPASWRTGAWARGHETRRHCRPSQPGEEGRLRTPKRTCRYGVRLVRTRINQLGRLKRLEGNGRLPPHAATNAVEAVGSRVAACRAARVRCADGAGVTQGWPVVMPIVNHMFQLLLCSGPPGGHPGGWHPPSSSTGGAAARR